MVSAAESADGRTRIRYLDLFRVLAIGAVVLGHWLLTDITYRSGQLSGLDALEYVGWGRWLTLPFQVMPVFFLVGGYANAISWTAHREQGYGWTSWVRTRAMRLLWPTTVYLTVAIGAVTVARFAGVNATTLAQAGWLVAMQLWFLPVYLLLIALTPALYAAQRRWGLAVPTVMALGAAGVDACVLGPHLPLIGFANYLLVWGSMHQWGFAWHDGTLTSRRCRPYAIFAGSTALLCGLLAWSPFPVDMIGAGERIDNTTPPSIALLAFAAAQIGLVLAVTPAAARLLTRPGVWRLVSRLNPMAVTIYLWHMVPVLIVAVAFYPTGVMPQPSIGSGLWWLLRLAWFAVLTAVLIPLVAAVNRLERPLVRLPTGIATAGPWSPALLAVGLAAVMAGLTRLAIAGFAPSGQLPALALAAYAGGLVLVLLSGGAQPSVQSRAGDAGGLRAAAGASRQAPAGSARQP